MPEVGCPGHGIVVARVALPRGHGPVTQIQTFLPTEALPGVQLGSPCDTHPFTSPWCRGDASEAGVEDVTTLRLVAAEGGWQLPLLAPRHAQEGCGVQPPPSQGAAGRFGRELWVMVGRHPPKRMGLFSLPWLPSWGARPSSCHGNGAARVKKQHLAGAKRGWICPDGRAGLPGVELGSGLGS